MKGNGKKRMKLSAGLVVPVMVLLLTLTAVGASFAWFSDSATAQIATINFSTSNIFTLQFDLSTNQSSLVNDEYHGQTAYNTTTGAYISGGSDNDYVFTFRSRVKIDTDETTINMNVFFENLQIGFFDENAQNPTQPILNTAQPNIVLPSTGHTDVSAIRYGFTWYFYKEGAADTLFTPYGVGSTVGANSPSAAWNGATPVQQPIPAFSSSMDDTYVFVIVFCPEKLYWMQRSTYVDGGIANNVKTFQQLYNTTGQVFDTGSDGEYARKYTGNEYQGADFKFTVTFERVQ